MTCRSMPPGIRHFEIIGQPVCITVALFHLFKPPLDTNSGFKLFPLLTEANFLDAASFNVGQNSPTLVRVNRTQLDNVKML